MSKERGSNLKFCRNKCSNFEIHIAICLAFFSIDIVVDVEVALAYCDKLETAGGFSDPELVVAQAAKRAPLSPLFLIWTWKKKTLRNKEVMHSSMEVEAQLSDDNDDVWAGGL